MRQTGSGTLLCPGVATLALHVYAGYSRVCCMTERNGLRHFHSERRISVPINESHGKHPHRTKEAEGVQEIA